MKKKSIKFVFIAILILLCPIALFLAYIFIPDVKYNSIKENSTGREVTIIAETYINAEIVSTEWDENILECIDRGTCETGKFAGRLRKQFFVYKGVNEGETNVVFNIDKYGELYQKTYRVEVSNDHIITVISTDTSPVRNSKKTEGAEKTEENTADMETIDYFGLYRETLQNIIEADDYSVQGYELVYIDDDDMPELVASVEYFGGVLFIYTISDGKVIPYNVSEEWFTVEEPLEASCRNGLDLGQGNANQIKEAFYMPGTRVLLYKYCEGYSSDDMVEDLYIYDGHLWEKASADNEDFTSSPNWVNLCNELKQAD